MDDFNKNKGLRPAFSPFGIWAFSIGTSIGWGSFIVTCNTYLQKSGILGTAFGLLIGMAVIMVITWNLQYMIQAAPDSGGIYTFAKMVNGKDYGFIAFWFILLTYMAILWANITSVPLFARFFLGDTFHFGFHYHIFGYEVWLGEALLSVVTVILISLLCSKSTRLPDRIMTAAAAAFAAGFTICAVTAMLRHGSEFSYAPLYNEGSGAFVQTVHIAAISPWAFIGYENISHFSEEYAFQVKKVRRILLLSVVMTTVLYILVSVLSISAYPPEYENWLAYIRDMGSLSGIKAVPAFYAADHYMGRTGVTILMLALFGVILTSLVGNMMALSRLLYAAGREGEAPKALMRLNSRGIPDRAVFFIAAVSVFMPFLGRTAIGWIVDVTTLGATIIYGMISYSVLSHAGYSEHRREQITGIAGVVLMTVFLVLILIPGLLPFHAMETESYVLFIAWALLGLAYFRQLVRRDHHREFGKSYIVWIILLMLVLFASMMWVSRATESAADRAVEEIFEYHETHRTEDSDENVRADRVEFLRSQADKISSTNTLYTLVSLGLFLLTTIIMLNNYRDTRVLGERLAAAEEAARSARKIAELKESISSLLNNMPGMCFSKDSGTGVYLACNQAFADYAGKESPEGVVGLTDKELFDPETARHFIEDDRMALSMEGSHSFFEDVPDALGERRQFQTIKLKFMDDAGRLCVLGMCREVTELVRMQRENENTKEAYENARNSGLVYSRLAQALARGYSDLYYVNTETEDYIEYITDDETGSLSEAGRGTGFFEQCRLDARRRVYSDDMDAFLNTMEKGALLNALDRNKTSILTYRLISESGPTYVTMKISRMADDKRFIIIGVTDVDEQMKQHRANERAKEERIAYARLNALSGDFICVYVIDPESGFFREFSSTTGYDFFGQAKEGRDFFTSSRNEIRKFIHRDDLDRVLAMFTPSNVMSEIRNGGIFTLTYRLVMEGGPRYVQLRAAMVDEKEGRRLIVGLSDIDSSVRREEEYAHRLTQAQMKASIDALTGVKNRHSYLDAEEKMDSLIAEGRAPAFAVSILDINDLKTVNDTEGHQAGDQYIRDACRIVCNIFQHSPVFRMGGDEFAVISQGRDYEHIDELVRMVDEHNREAARTGGIVIACGMARYEGEGSVAPVFERADQRMYDNKSTLKELASVTDAS
ncbi:MAG: amino acid permease [Lachnospiraceae bacterium]|nr:amino acid permease [Lachnospiraceae bacterium]